MKSLYDFYELYMSGKAKSRVLGLFLTWLTILHIHIIFTALFVDQQLIYRKYSLLKGEYISDKYLQFTHWSFWLYEFGAILAAAAITWLTIWILPRALFKQAYTRELADDYDRKLAKVTKELELEKAKEKLTEKQIVVAKKEKEVIKEQEDTDTEIKRRWTRDYQTFKNTDHFQYMQRIMKVIYEDGGDARIKSDYGNPTGKLMLPTETLAYLDSKDIINIPNYGQIQLTKKGRYFLDRFQS